jgi:ABC-type antimicrobial peptide transport system permease subunit
LQIAWHKFRKNRLALFGLLVLAGACVIAILGSTIRPDASADANDQHLSLAKKPINFAVKMLAVRKNAEIDKGSFFSRFFFGGKESVNNSVPLES